MISVVIPLYNKERQIANTVSAVLSQTYQNIEIVIVNDGSTDNSVGEVKKFSDSRIRLVSQCNAGVSAARNRGIEEARGEYIAFLDADDEWGPEYLETQYLLTRKYPECNVFACNYEFRNADGVVKNTIIRKLPFEGEDGILSNYFEVASCSHPPLWTSAVMVRKTAIQAVGGFPVGVKSGEDLLTWARLAVQNSIAFTQKPMSIYNLGDGYDKKNLPPRRQDEGDPVGIGLKELYNSHRDTVGIRKYISHWHKMRASVAVRYDESWETICEVLVSLKYNIFNVKVMPFMVLAILPKRLKHRIISYY